MKHALRDAFSLVKKPTGQAAKRQKLYYDRALKVRVFEKRFMGLEVVPSTNKSNLGPMLDRALSCFDLTYTIQTYENTLPVIVYVRHLKLYLGRNLPHNLFLRQTNSHDTSITI